MVKTSDINSIPIMTSNTAPSGIAKASGVYSSNYAWKAFDRQSNTSWTAPADANSGWISYMFPIKKIISKYNIINTAFVNSSPKDWTFEGSNDEVSWDVLDTKQSMIFDAYEKKEFVINNNNEYIYYRLNIKRTNGSTPSISDVEMYERIPINKILILDNGLYKKWNIATSKLETVTSTQPNESDFIDNGNEKSDLELIPSDVWELLVNHDVKVVEYTDNPNQVESVLTIETEQFSFYDEMGDSVDILYYTDNPEKTSANLEITHNYSPLDDLDGDFDVITYTDNEDMERIELNIEALPTGQIVIDNKDIKLYGLLKKLSVEKFVNDLADGILKVVLSFDSGYTWYTFNNGVWSGVDITSKDEFITKGIEYRDIQKISNDDFSKISLGDKVRLAYYLEEHANEDNNAKVTSVSTLQNQPLETPILSNASFYIINTVSTINLTLSGKLIDGKIDDVDGGKVKYKVSLNGQPYYPKDGSYTDFSLTPLDISLRLSNDDVLINNQNTLRVDIMDYWGEIDFWETTFIGKYNGLMFSDINGDYYSDDVGKIIKYLDFGTLIAGQVSTESEIKVFNTYGYPVKNLTISSTNNYEGVVIELSKTTNPFLANDTLLWNEEMADGESKTFFVRIVTNYTTPPVSGGMFEIRVDADQV